MDADARTRPAATGRLRALAWLAVPIVIAALALGRWVWVQRSAGAPEERGRRPVPVEVAPIVHGTLEASRELTGTLEPSARAIVAAEITGTVETVDVRLADEVAAQDVLARIDDRAYRQAEAAARAELAVARARAEAARSGLTLAERALERTSELARRGVASERVLDDARATEMQARANLTVATAEVARARAAWNAARLELERTRVRGRWSADAGPRRVAIRHVDEGARVSPGDPLFTLIDTDPLIVAIMVGPADHARLRPGQSVSLFGQTEEAIEGRVARVAPAFDPQSRQARVEIEVPNPDGRLPPGMFVRAATTIERVEEATIVPEVALVTRDDREVIFVLDEQGTTVRMLPVEPGLRSAGRVQLRDTAVRGRVVTLGQQRLTDGARVRVTEPAQ